MWRPQGRADRMRFPTGPALGRECGVRGCLIPGHPGQTAKSGHKPISIERLLLLENVEHFAGHDAADQPPGFLVAHSRRNQKLVRLAGLGRVVASKLVVHHFQDDCLQPRVVIWTCHVRKNAQTNRISHLTNGNIYAEPFAPGRIVRIAATLSAKAPYKDATMRILPFIVLAVFSNALCAGDELPRCSPEQQGVSSAGVQAFVEAADKNIDSLHSFMLLRHGHVLAEGWWTPYDAQSRHSLYSLSKSFTSTAVGLAVAEGKLSVDDQVLKFFPQDAPAQPSANLKSMRVSDLLRMSTGHQSEPARTAEEPWVRTFLAHPVPFKPGTHFLYNTSGTYMLSAIVQKATGQTVLDYLQPRLFKPLGIDNPTWETKIGRAHV